MRSSAQNSSGVHWCRRRVRFNEVPEEVLKVPEMNWEALLQSQVTFQRSSGKGSGEGLGQVTEGSGEGSVEGSGKP